MKKLLTIATALPLLTLGACAGLSNPNNAVFAVESSYTVAQVAESTYLNTPSPNKTTVLALKKARTSADKVLNPIFQEAAAGKATSDEAVAAQAALAAFQAVLTAHGINPTPNP